MRHALRSTPANGTIHPQGKSPGFNVVLPPDIAEELKAYAAREGLTISAVIRSAVIKMMRAK